MYHFPTATRLLYRSAMDQAPTQYDLSPTPYGRACMNCSHAKCKCVLSKAGGQCQRCQRLNKECRPSAFQRRQNLRKPNATKSGRLEKKLDDVVALLRARAAHSSGSSATADEYADLIEEQLNSTSTTTPEPQPRNPRGDSQKRRRGGNTHSQLTQTSEQGANGPGLTNDSPDVSLELSPWQAEECLAAFVTQKLPYLPFIHIPSSTTAKRLQRERPFMWLCVMAVAAKSVKQRNAICDKVREIVAQKVVHCSGARDLDLLQGILIFMAWSGQQVFRKLSLIMFSQLAIAVVYDLSLNKPTSTEMSLLLCLNPQPEGGPASPPTRFMEERRAVLGCFLLTSSISLFFGKAESLRWTPYLEECLKALSQHPECLNDEVLVHQVRYQLVNEQKSPSHASSNTELHPFPLPPATNLYDNTSLNPPISTYLHALNTHLHSAQAKIPPQTQQYKIIHLHNTHVILTLTEPALLLTPKPQQQQSTTLNIRHLETLHAALAATKAWFDTFLAIPPAEYTGFAFTVFAQLARNLAALYRLSTLDDPLWDRAAVRRTVDILDVLDSVIGNLGQAAALARLEGLERGLLAEAEVDEGEVFFYSIGKYESMRLVWERKLGGRGDNNLRGRGGLESERMQQQQHVSGTLDQESGGALGTLGLGVGYDDWLMEFLSSMVQ
ncbi:Zn(II)2Cys6 transcription factor [Aspergillus homomorphus CBS 101889]|uniref:Zn(2)-C6 fungal-type domain-containing protein n=1 Tax=Aspergillus homomorphus (strain CBS 101889) TaxID=1450537 RepID=A0A395I3X8_ASPHC|nr:hypothetical protein BO97DRAFT_466163 [Aspergillus homomorphus CBS 101889]RAL14436.1 hypothetical protein BO97DRAFT_466163 [Aspergillus homomorphus CBS 101889]